MNIYKIMDSSDVVDEISEDYINGGQEYYDDNNEFISFDAHREMSFEKIASKLFNDSDSISIMRRNFRLGDIIKNNTKIGNISKWDADLIVKTKNKKHRYIDFAGDIDTDKSISKTILTDNAKKLRILLDNFRGYVISNFKRIKENAKKNTKKFTNNDIKTFKKLNLSELKTIENLELEGNLSITFNISYSSINNGKLIISYYKNQVSYKTLYKFYSDFEDMQKFSKLIENEEDIEYLKNFVNLSGDVKTSKDYYEFKKVITRISKKDIFKWKEPIMAIYSDNIKLSPETINRFKNFYEENVDEKNWYRIDLNNEKINKGLVDLLHSVMSEYYPNLKASSYSIKPIDSDNMDVEFKIIIE